MKLRIDVVDMRIANHEVMKGRETPRDNPRTQSADVFTEHVRRARALARAPLGSKQ